MVSKWACMVCFSGKLLMFYVCFVCGCKKTTFFTLIFRFLSGNLPGLPWTFLLRPLAPSTQRHSLKAVRMCKGSENERHYRQTRKSKQKAERGANPRPKQIEVTWSQPGLQNRSKIRTKTCSSQVCTYQ